MAKRCPRGFVCTDTPTMIVVILVLVALTAGVMWFSGQQTPTEPQKQNPQVIVVQTPNQNQNQNPSFFPSVGNQQFIRPDLYPEPVRRGGGFAGLATRPIGAGPVQQIGILTGEGGSANSAAPDRTILPLFGREMDPRRGRWNYYTRTDGSNPVQVPVRFRNRLCDDDTNGCEEVSNDDAVHVPALGRSFKATVYRTSMFS
jgi:hypothetical protein